MILKRFLSHLLYGVFFLSIGVPCIHSMGDVLPLPPAPIGGDGPSVSLPEALPITSNPIADTGLVPGDLPQDLANIDPTTLSNIESMAHPSNYQVETGNIRIWAPDSNTLELDQYSSLPGSHPSQMIPSTGIVNFNHLSTRPGETFLIRYLNSDGTLRENPRDSTLIRILGGETSHFSGNLLSNGNLALSNPAGITFEKESNTTVRGLLATTAHITNEDFLTGSQTGRYNFTKGAQDGAIVNHGKINLISGGFAALLGNTVLDDGVMLGQLSRVIVAGAESYVLSFDGDSLIGFEITSTRESKEAKPLKEPSVEHSGSIINKGGLVLVTTKDAQKFVFEDSVNIKSIPQAASVEEHDGIITLKGTISVDGPQGGSIWAESSKDMILDHATLTANGTEQKGGNVVVLGPELRSFGSTLRADGKLGGGKVLFGGDFQGKNPNINNSINTFLDPDTHLSVNALEDGDGGQFVIWADNLTRNWSTTESKGGANGGNGGPKNEISGKEDLDHHGKINTLAPKGEPGTTLLDPRYIVIAAGGGGFPPLYFTSAPSEGTATVDPGNLAGGNVVLQATAGMTINSPITSENLDISASLTLQSGGDIQVNANITTNNGDLLLRANDSASLVRTGGGISSAGYTLSSGTGNLSLIVDKSGGTPGDISVGPLISSGGITVSTPQHLMLDTITATGGVLSLTGLLGITTGHDIINQGNINLIGPLTLTNNINIEIPEFAGDININGNILGNSHNLTLTSAPTHSLNFTGTISNVGAFISSGDGTNNFSGSISSATQSHRGLSLLDALTLITTGDLYLGSAVQGAKDLTLNIGGDLTYLPSVLLSTIFNGQSSLTIKNNAGGLGTRSLPILVSLGDLSAGTSDVLFLGSTRGGYFKGSLNTNSGANAKYAKLIDGTTAPFYFNTHQVVNPPSPQPDTSPVNKQTSGNITDNAVTSSQSSDTNSQILTDKERQNKILSFVSTLTAQEAEEHSTRS